MSGASFIRFILQTLFNQDKSAWIKKFFLYIVCFNEYKFFQYDKFETRSRISLNSTERRWQNRSIDIDRAEFHVCVSAATQENQ